MLRVALPYIFEIAEQLEGLSRLPDADATLDDVFMPLYIGSSAIQGLSNSIYLNALRQSKKGDEKILAALKQMTDLHRNPLIHPEVILTTDESIATLGIARSVITAMLAVLPVQPPTTTTAAAASAAP
ncbi:hypothetical protein [Nitrobacter sp. TKz-YC01]|uniref:hypothetical protein n=1 Tax=Nitrobacter sp. TKz-YC01 TaxID=3398703 RepID=UPI003A0FE49D